MNTPNEIARGAYSVRAFCAAYNVSRTRAYEELKAGRLKAKKLGKRTLIGAADAEAWLAELPTTSATRAH